MSAKTQNVDAVRATQDSAGGDTRYRYPPQTVCKLPRSGLDMAIWRNAGNQEEGLGFTRFGNFRVRCGMASTGLRGQ